LADWWTQYIRARAGKYGIDPKAALAVARMEGLSGGVGDGGHAFGPFQLNDAGGVITGRAGDHRQFAESQAGIDFALERMAQAGARGKKGFAAIDAIVRNFERPADPDHEVAGARAAYGQNVKVPRGATGTKAPGVAQAAPVAPGSAGNADAMRQAFMSMLMQQNASYASGGDDGGNSAMMSALATMNTLRRLQTAEPQAQVYRDGKSVQDQKLQRPPTPGGQPKGNWQDYVVLGKTADRPGVSTRRAVLQFVGSLGMRYGRPLTIGTGTNHDRLTVDGNVSNHWTGMAADIPATGAQLRRLGYLALIQAGMDPKEAARARKTGGLFNVGPYQIIFATKIGGNHFNHLHFGIRGS
jgi:hypothetical protein